MKDLGRAWEQARSLENIDAHEEAGKSPEYIGSREKGNRIYDFFEMTESITGTGCGSASRMDRPFPKRKAFSDTGSGIRERDGRTYHEN